MADRTTTSTEFRQNYAKWLEPVTVTALGRPIGTWYPAGTERKIDLNGDIRPVVRLTDPDPVGEVSSTTGSPVFTTTTTQGATNVPAISPVTNVDARKRQAEFIAERKARQAVLDKALKK